MFEHLSPVGSQLNKGKPQLIELAAVLGEVLPKQETEFDRLQDFFECLRASGIPVSMAEWLDVQRLLTMGRITTLTEMHFKCRAFLVKDARYDALYDQVFKKVFLQEVIDHRKSEEMYFDQESVSEEERQAAELEQMLDQNRPASVSELSALQTKINEITRKMEKIKSLYVTPTNDLNEVVQYRRGQILPTSEGMGRRYQRVEKFMHGRWWESHPEVDSDSSYTVSHVDFQEMQPADYEQMRMFDSLSKKLNKRAEQIKSALSPLSKLQQQVKQVMNGDTPMPSHQEGGNGNPADGSVQMDRSAQINLDLGQFSGAFGTSHEEMVQILDRIEEGTWLDSETDRVLTPDQVKKALEKLKKKFTNYSRIKTSRLDIKKSVLRSSKKPGLPELVYKSEVLKEKPNIILLADVSGSVHQLIPLMRSVVEGLSSVTNMVGTFYFFDKVEQDVYSDEGLSSKQDIITVLQENKQSLVLIYGDTLFKSQGDDDEAFKLLGKIKSNSKSVVWLQPNIEIFNANNSGAIDYDDPGYAMTYGFVRKIIDIFPLTFNGLLDAAERLLRK